MRVREEICKFPDQMTVAYRLETNEREARPADRAFDNFKAANSIIKKNAAGSMFVMHFRIGMPVKRVHQHRSSRSLLAENENGPGIAARLYQATEFLACE
jgi:hypothetical protein